MSGNYRIFKFQISETQNSFTQFERSSCNDPYRLRLGDMNWNMEFYMFCSIWISGTQKLKSGGWAAIYQTMDHAGSLLHEKGTIQSTVLNHFPTICTWLLTIQLANIQPIILFHLTSDFSSIYEHISAVDRSKTFFIKFKYGFLPYFL